MRTFVKTHFVKRSAQITVIHDSETREFEVWKWTATEGLVRVTAFVHAAGASVVAKESAMKYARGLYEAAFDDPLAPTTETICAYCPGFDRTDPKNAGASHGMCATCQARENAKLDAIVAGRNEEQLS